VSKASRSRTSTMQPSPPEDTLHQQPPPYLHVHGHVAQAVGRDIAEDPKSLHIAETSSGNFMRRRASTIPPMQHLSSDRDAAPCRHDASDHLCGQRWGSRVREGWHHSTRLQPQPRKDVCEELPERVQTANHRSVCIGATQVRGRGALALLHGGRAQDLERRR